MDMRLPAEIVAAALLDSDVILHGKCLLLRQDRVLIASVSEMLVLELWSVDLMLTLIALVIQLFQRLAERTLLDKHLVPVGHEVHLGPDLQRLRQREVRLVDSPLLEVVSQVDRH